MPDRMDDRVARLRERIERETNGDARAPLLSAGRDINIDTTAVGLCRLVLIACLSLWLGAHFAGTKSRAPIFSEQFERTAWFTHPTVTSNDRFAVLTYFCQNYGDAPQNAPIRTKPLISCAVPIYPRTSHHIPPPLSYHVPPNSRVVAGALARLTMVH